MEIPEKILDRYILTRRLALNGKDGEKKMAQRMIAKLQSEYPNIEEQATLWEKLQEGDFDNTSNNQETSSHWSDVYKEQQRNEAEWKRRFSQWGQAATSAFSWAATMASQAFGVQEARNLAMEQTYTTITMRKNASGSQTMNVRISEDVLAYLHYMNEDQKATYCNAVATRLANELYQSL